MKQTRLIMAGGFLGAGKTTLIWKVAQKLMAEGKRVGLVTNDQAPELVDSRLLEQAELKVAEVAGSCFCCNFNGFVEAINSLRKDIEADVILAEPVGSCADLSATIVNPLKKFHNTELLISPLTVLAAPDRLHAIVYGSDADLHEDASYIYRKQLEEADVILITKTDTLSAEEKVKLEADTKKTFPNTLIMTCSSKDEEGIMEWYGNVSSRENAGEKLLDIDYDKYAHGEAVLGWLNGTLTLTGKDMNMDLLLKEVMEAMEKAFKAERLRIGHVKVIVENGKDYAVGNIAGANTALTLRGKAGCGDHARMIVNARVETTPEHLDELIKSVLLTTFEGKCSEEVLAWRYLQPGRPNPTHRFTDVVS